MGGVLSWLSTVATALFAINTGAEIGHKIQTGARQGAQRRAEHRVQPSPRRAAHWFTAALRQSGHAAVAHPGLHNGTWYLVAEYEADTGQRPPATFEGYPVLFQVAQSKQDRKVLR